MVPPLTPGAPLPRTIIPPSPGGPRLDALTASSRRATKLRAPPIGSKRSLTVGVKKPAPKVAKTKVEVVQAIDKVIGSKNGVSLMDLPGGAQLSTLPCSKSTLTRYRDPELDLYVHRLQLSPSSSCASSSPRLAAFAHTTRPAPHPSIRHCRTRARRCITSCRSLWSYISTQVQGHHTRSGDQSSILRTDSGLPPSPPGVPPSFYAEAGDWYGSH